MSGAAAWGTDVIVVNREGRSRWADVPYGLRRIPTVWHGTLHPGGPAEGANAR